VLPLPQRAAVAPPTAPPAAQPAAPPQAPRPEARTSIKNWHADDRPREKALARGLGALTDAELLATVLGSGTVELSALDLSRLLVERFGGLKGLASAQARELQTVKGVGPAKALSIAAIFELGRRRQREEAQAPVFHTLEGLIDYLMPRFADETVEVFRVLYLTRANRLLGEREVGRGGVSHVVVDPRVIFREAVQFSASKLVMAHNHPGGSARPSREDYSLTDKLVAGAQLLDMAVEDHLIFAPEGVYSFRQSGTLGA
jgi:DNA repair protein RadC